MLGDLMPLADNLFLVVGDMPADVPNVLVYRKDDRLYLLDSGAGPAIRAGILKVLVWGESSSARSQLVGRFAAQLDGPGRRVVALGGHVTSAQSAAGPFAVPGGGRLTGLPLLGDLPRSCLPRLM